MGIIACFLPLSCLLLGFIVCRRIFRAENGMVQLWLSGVMGLFALIWLPALWAFLLDFTVGAQLAAMLTALAGAGIAAKGSKPFVGFRIFEWKTPLACVLPVWLFCFYLLHTHTLRQAADGSLHTGQSTYGDMAMHLGFVTSISEQKVFPPEYSLLPGNNVGYPFLCDSVSSTFYTLGLPLRWAYILPALWALAVVLLGVFLLFRQMLQSSAKAALGYIFFVLGGGFGIFYFIGGGWQNFTRIFTAFYETPTNYVEENIYWVNPVADLLIPQRATLMGWSILFACLFLLYRAAIEKQTAYFAPLAVLAGGLPLLHTHSFLALGILSAVLLADDLLTDRRQKVLKGWAIYGVGTLLLASWQLFGFTFQQAQGEQFVRFAWNWVNKTDFYLWFYIKNIGVVYLLLVPAFLHANKKQRLFYGASLAILAISEIIIFQPNPYDNNKLLFIWHLLGCGMVANLVWDCYCKFRKRLLAKAALGVVVFFATISGVLTLGREAVSDYQLFSKQDVETAEYIKENTAADSLILTANNHNNLVAALTGRNILCGSPSYLYYHGVSYAMQSNAAAQLYQQPSDALLQQWDIDYVLIGRYERSQFAVDEAWCRQNLPVAFQTGDITLYDAGGSEQ